MTTSHPPLPRTPLLPLTLIALALSAPTSPATAQAADGAAQAARATRAGAAAAASAPTPAARPVPQNRDLTVETIFGTRELAPDAFGMAGWHDATRFSFIEHDARRGVVDLWAQDAVTGERERLLDGAVLVPPGGDAAVLMEDVAWSLDNGKALVFTNTQRVWRDNTKGIYYVYDFEAERVIPVSAGEGWQMFAKFSPSGDRVAFVRDNDLFVTDLATGRETRLTRDGSEDIINGTFDWVYEEELGLQDGFRWSPDGTRIAFWRLDQSAVKSFPLVNELELYPEITTLPYPKAGEENSTARIGVIELATGRVTWMETGVDPDVYLARMDWAASPDELVIQRLNRHQNRLDVLLADARTGASRVILSDTDDAWVDVDDDLTWVDGGRRFLWSSEKDGWNHLYLHERDGRLVRQVTQGPWEVTSYYGWDAEAGWIYFQSTKDSPQERHVYRVRLDGSRLERLTREPGVHRADFGPGMRYFVDTYSRLHEPPVARLAQSDGRVVRTLVDNAEVKRRLATYGLAQPEFFEITTDDGVTLDAWQIRPPGFDPSRKYPVLMYVYGGPGSQTVLDSWGGSRYLWHQLLAEQGYVVVSVDNRGTGGRGRDFKKQTYQRLGQLESADQVAAAREIAELPWVDAGRIGIWGWSYGGYMTLLSMMKGGELFEAGISVAPVTDWRFYDTIYTERFMRTPQENPSGYRQGSPLAHVEGLEGELLLVHGTGDDNVHPQNTTTLLAELQAANKQFGLMLYPNKTHSIGGAEAQVHLFTMMTRWVREHLGAGTAGQPVRATS